MRIAMTPFEDFVQSQVSPEIFQNCDIRKDNIFRSSGNFFFETDCLNQNGNYIPSGIYNPGKEYLCLGDERWFAVFEKSALRKVIGYPPYLSKPTNDQKKKGVRVYIQQARNIGLIFQEHGTDLP